MHLDLIGQPTAPVVAVLSTWDPFHQEHQRLLWALQSYARRRALSPVAVMLDPAPAQVIQGDDKWAVYHDPMARIRFLDRTGLDAVALVHFEPDDLKLAAKQFFALVRAHVPLAEFWLRHGQSIGSGSGGNDLAVWIQGKVLGFKVRMLPREDRGRDNGAMARHHLKEGRVQAASRAVGEWPTMAQPLNGECRTAWKSGRYVAVDALASARAESQPLAVDFLQRDDGSTTVSWPDDRIRALRFLAGPLDDTSRVAPPPIAGA